MTESKHRKLRKEEIEDWFASDVTKQFFAHLDLDFNSILDSRKSLSGYNPGEPYKTQEGLAFSAGMEYVLTPLLDSSVVNEKLAGGFQDE